eukprot:jgi/Psemu1/44755/gm1.44755_g
MEQNNGKEQQNGTTEQNNRTQVSDNDNNLLDEILFPTPHGNYIATSCFPFQQQSARTKNPPRIETEDPSAKTSINKGYIRENQKQSERERERERDDGNSNMRDDDYVTMRDDDNDPRDDHADLVHLVRGANPDRSPEGRMVH